MIISEILKKKIQLIFNKKYNKEKPKQRMNLDILKVSLIYSNSYVFCFYNQLFKMGAKNIK